MKKWVSTTIIALLAVNTVLNIASLIATPREVKYVPSVEDNIKTSNAWNQYLKDIGKKYIQVVDDKISTSSYNTKSIVGKVVNNADKTVEGIEIEFAFYKGDDVIGYTSEYVKKIKPNSSLNFDCYISDELQGFDRYEIESILGVIYE